MVKNMSHEAIEQAVAQLIENGLANRSTIQGCSEAEIAILESTYGVTLPTVYREFLATMGRSAGSFLVGTNYLYRHLLELREIAEALLEEDNTSFRLDKADFVFAAHQGYEFLFFRTTESNDPSIFHFHERDEMPKKVFEHFSEWLRTCISDEIAIS
jgi:hypothetical protein